MGIKILSILGKDVLEMYFSVTLIKKNYNYEKNK